jgi:1-acyl-sn-glycerol-3-phosphate acyltransferase
VSDPNDKPGRPAARARPSAGRAAPPTPQADEGSSPPPAAAPDASRRVAARPGRGVRAKPAAKRAPAVAAPKPVGATAQEHLYEAERSLGALLDDVHQAGSDVEARRRAAAAIGQIASRLDPGVDSSDGAGPDALLSTARQLLSTDYYLKQWGRLGMRYRSEQVDDFGLDPTYEARVMPAFEAAYKRYFRVQAEGIERIPADRGVLLVCNHSGALPWDGAMLKTAVRVEHPARPDLRWLTEDYVYHAPFLGAFFSRIGSVRACPENAERLLSHKHPVAVFPEGIKGIGKPFAQRYRLQRFGRGGYVKLALRMGVPILPVAIVGSEETYPLLYKVKPFAKALGLPFVPVTPTFPWLGPLGAVPLPSRWRIQIGDPITELEAYGPEDAEDPVVVNQLNEQVRTRLQGMLDANVAARGARVYF